MVAGIGENSHIALEVQHEGIPHSKADQKTTKK